MDVETNIMVKYDHFSFLSLFTMTYFVRKSILDMGGTVTWLKELLASCRYVGFPLESGSYIENSPAGALISGESVGGFSK